MSDILDLDGIPAPIPEAPTEVQPIVPMESPEALAVENKGGGASDRAEAPDTDDGGQTEPADDIRKATKIRYDPTAEPYMAGRCTITLALTIQPDDGHPEGRLVIIGAKSHAETPAFVSARLNTLALPTLLADLLAQYEASLPARSEKAAAAKVQAEEKKKAEAEKRAQIEAERREQRQAKATKREAKSEKPKPPAQLEAEQKAAAKAELLAQAKAEAAQAAMF